MKLTPTNSTVDRLTKSVDGIYAARMASSLAVPKVRPKLIDLFCGAGGMTLGFTRFGHSFQSVWANDNNQWAIETFRKNFGCGTLGDIQEILNRQDFQVPTADVVIGGPPCQGFSLLNKKREGDPRKQLWRPFLNVVVASQASIFVMENVPQLLGSAEHAAIKEVAEGLGFAVTEAVLCAADYGVPQKRFRAFIVGCKHMDPKQAFPPRKTHYSPNISKGVDLFSDLNGYTDNAEPWVTVRQAISDLEPPMGTNIRSVKSPYDLHFGRTPTDQSLLRYMSIPNEGMNRFDLQRKRPDLTPKCWINKKSGGTDLFGRLWWDRPSLTIRTEFYKPEKGRYLHPSQHRPITHREAARLQSFPDEFAFVGSKIEVAKQIGNAVPPMLAARVADSVYYMWQAKKRNHVRSIHEEQAKPHYVGD